jgi:hypothetical protein
MEDIEKRVMHEFPSDLLKSLNSLWQEDCFCDVRLTVGQREFPAHRLVLAAASPYFKAMFMCGLDEGKMESIPLHDISPVVFESLLKFVYSGELRLNEFLPFC